MWGSKINYFVCLRSILRTVAIRLEFFIRVYAYAYAVHKSDISIEIPYGFSCTVWYPYMYMYSCTCKIHGRMEDDRARARVLHARTRSSADDMSDFEHLFIRLPCHGHFSPTGD